MRDYRLMIKHPKLIFALLLATYGCYLNYLDRYMLKANKSFCVWELFTKDVSCEKGIKEDDDYLCTEGAKKLFSQPLTYLGKGHQSVVFLSHNQDFVVKFYRFPLHMRPMCSLVRPLSSLKSKRRATIDSDRRKFDMTIKSHRLAFTELGKESALVASHLHKTTGTSMTANIIDYLNKSYKVELQNTIFIVQKKGELLFPRLQALIDHKREDIAEKIIDNVISFLYERTSRGYIDQDAMLTKNYGLIGEQLFQLDTGRIEKTEETLPPEEVKKEVVKATESLKYWLLDRSPALYVHFSKIIDRL